MRVVRSGFYNARDGPAIPPTTTVFRRWRTAQSSTQGHNVGRACAPSLKNTRADSQLQGHGWTRLAFCSAQRVSAVAGVANRFLRRGRAEIETPHEHITGTDLVIRWRSRTSANAAHAARPRAYDAWRRRNHVSLVGRR